MKSMCHDSRRNSPSVIERSPASSWRRMTSRIASSSIARRSSSEMRPAARSSLAFRTSGGRSRLPTWSARYGGLSRAAIGRSLGGRLQSRDRTDFVDNPVDNPAGALIDDDGYRALRDAIVAGELLPTERLVEEDLARRLGLGRAAVRMALVRLEHDGLVESERNRGARVRRGGGAGGGGGPEGRGRRGRRVGDAEAFETLGVRAALESRGARKAAARATPSDVRELRAILREMRVKREGGDLMAVSDANARLHRRILEISGHGTAQRLSGMLISQIVRYQYRTVLLPGCPQRSYREHTAIVDAIAAGDGEAAERAMRRHLSQVAEALRARAEAGSAAAG